jgi:hypothetical protein
MTLLRLSWMTRFQLIGVDFGNVLRIVVLVGRANRAKLRRSCKGGDDANGLCTGRILYTAKSCLKVC